MGTINNNWYSGNASRNYPLDDTATLVGDAKNRMLNDVIVDMSLRWPKLAGQYAFIAGVTVSKTLLTVVILAADSPTDATGATPIASITLSQPVDIERHYSLEALYPGAGGFIAFGDTAEEFNIRFSTPAQGLLCPKAAQPYDALPVPSMRKNGRIDGLTGLVKILGGTNVEVVKDFITYDGVEKEAIIIRLVAPTSSLNVLQDFIGPCGARPESRNCDKPGIETIGGVEPDCDGNLNLEFRSLTASPYSNCGRDYAGVTVDQTIGIAEACSTFGPGEDNGTVDCFDSSSAMLEAEAFDDFDSPILTELDLQEPEQTSEVFEDLPYLETFEDIEHTWHTVAGRYILRRQENDTTIAELTDSPRRQVMVWQGASGHSPLNKRISTLVRLPKRGTHMNGGLVLNLRQVGTKHPMTVYFQAHINRSENRLEIARFNGKALVTAQWTTPPKPFLLEEWYKLEAVTRQLRDFTVITVTASKPGDINWAPISLTLQTRHFDHSPGGCHGVGCYRSVVQFDQWEVRDA